MNTVPISRVGLRVIVASLALTCVFAGGLLAGLYLYPSALSNRDDYASIEPDSLVETESNRTRGDAGEDEAEEEEPHVALTEQALGNLNLEMGTAARRDYWKTVLVPAVVVEIPGQSDLSVSAPMTGVIEEIGVLAGQSLEPAHPMFTIRLTDDALTSAQTRLVDTITQQEIKQQELERLAPLITSGAVSGARQRELEYDLRQLRAQQLTLIQELRGRGMPEDLVQSVVQKRDFATRLKVYPPEFVQAAVEQPTRAITRPPSSQTATGQGSTGYAVEHVLVQPGMAVSRGDPLCSVSFHRELYIEGTAFEEDLPVLDRILENNWSLSMQVHSEEHGHTDHHVYPDYSMSSTPDALKILRIDNHVDEGTQTVRFYVKLTNQVSRSQVDNGRLFEQWRFRPGQRLHLRLPVERWKQQLVLPAEAVVVEGPDAYVFVEHRETPSGGQGPQTNRLFTTSSLASARVEAEDELPESFPDQFDTAEAEQSRNKVVIELEPVPVRILHRDDRFVVIADDGQLPADESVAMNNSYKLYLALKMQAGEGGGHHHDH